MNPGGKLVKTHEAGVVSEAISIVQIEMERGAVQLSRVPEQTLATAQEVR